MLYSREVYDTYTKNFPYICEVFTCYRKGVPVKTIGRAYFLLYDSK